MKSSLITALCVAGLVLAAQGLDADVARAATAPSITSLSAASLDRSGRLLISGAGFGTVQANGHVTVGGVTALVTRWSDTLIAAYVPEAASVGADPVRVSTAAGASNAVDLTVTTRTANGRVRWRFQADSDYILQRPALAPDGTIVAHDSGGFVYALTPGGGLKWIFKTRIFAGGPPSVGADGTVYVADSSTITAINPDGSLKWTFTEHQGGQGVMAGPTVGPDGNIYAITDIGGLGALALSPAGQLLWSNPGNPFMAEIGHTGAELVFGPARAGGAPDQFYAIFDDYTTDVRTHLYAFRLNGSMAWSVPLWMSKYTAMMYQQQPAVAPDGTVYASAVIPVGGNWSLNAFSPADGSLRGSFFPSPGGGMGNPAVGPDGAVYFAQTLSYLQSVSTSLAPRWQFFDGSSIGSPVISPTNTTLIAGVQPANGVPGEARAFNPATGAVLWTYNLGSENGFNIVLDSRARFTPDGTTAYFGSSIPGQTSNAYSYLYAFDTTGASPPPSAVLSSLSLSPTRVRGGSSSVGTVRLTGGAASGGAVVTLQSSSAGTASVPASITVPAGASSAAFAIRTQRVRSRQSVTITAVYGGVTKTAVLTVTR
jgi:PQQ-like domain/IPT/TIG domain